MDNKLYVTEGLFNKIILYIYENGESTAGELKENVTSNYSEKCSKLISLRILDIYPGEKKRRKYYVLTERGEKIAKLLEEANSLYIEEEKKEPTKNCPICDNDISRDSRFCNYCGYEFA